MSKYMFKVKINSFISRKELTLVNRFSTLPLKSIRTSLATPQQLCQGLAFFATCQLNPLFHNMHVRDRLFTCCFRTLWRAAPSSQEASFSTWKKIRNGGIGLCPCQTATPSDCMRGKQCVLAETFPASLDDWTHIY